MQLSLKIFITSIFALTSIWYLLIPADLQETSNPSIIPNVEVLSSDSGLHSKRGILYYYDKPFSGAVLAYFSNDQLKSSTQYLKGKRHGQSKNWYPNGQIRWQKNYAEGKEYGNQKSWNESGQPTSHYEINGENQRTVKVHIAP